MSTLVAAPDALSPDNPAVLTEAYASAMDLIQLASVDGKDQACPDKQEEHNFKAPAPEESASETTASHSGHDSDGSESATTEPLGSISGAVAQSSSLRNPNVTVKAFTM